MNTIMMVVLKYLIVGLISMLPLIELRGAIPFGVLEFKLNFYLVILVSIIFNVLLIPVVYYFLDHILKFLNKFKTWRKYWNAYIIKKEKIFKKKYYKYGLLGLYIFVAVPLPGTGVWTGTTIAYLFDFKRKDSFYILSLAVLTAGIFISFFTGVIDNIL